jgi:hypothetical protein
VVRTHQVLPDNEASRAGVDRQRLLFKVVQAWFNVQNGRVQSRFKHQERENLGYAARPRFPLDEAKRTTARAGCDRMRQPPGVPARQAQTLRSFRLLRLLGPPPSSKP